MRQFNGKSSKESDEEDGYILPPGFSELEKQVILIVVPYYKKNETSSKCFLKKFHKLANDLYEIKINGSPKRWEICFI